MTKNVYIICSVRKATEQERNEILAYTEYLRASGYTVRCPITDTDQVDQLGLRIVEEHEDDIMWANEVHIIWNPASEGSLRDAAQARMARYFMPEKKIIMVNAAEVPVTDAKSYTNVLLATHAGIGKEAGVSDLKERLQKMNVNREEGI